MIGRVQDKGKIARTDVPADRKEALPYRIELRGGDNPDAVERILAPDRRITLSRGSRLIADSAR